jgi:hypothetical protein
MELQTIAIDSEDEQVFEINEFELVLHSTGDYILCEDGYFALNGLESFKPFNDQFVIINSEDNSKFFLTAEEFELVKQAYLQK